MNIGTKPAAAVRLESYRLEVIEEDWTYAITHADAIAAYWREAERRNPALFNGEVFILCDVALMEDRLIGTYRPTRFAAYLHWRDHGFDQTYGHDGFACAVIVSADGRVLLAKATAGTLNDGLRVFPGGLIDRRDVTSDGTVDIHVAAKREMIEETGLGEADVEAGSELYVAFCGPLVGLGVPFRSRHPAAELKHRIDRHLTRQDLPELVAPNFATPEDVMADGATPEYVRLLLAGLCDPDQPG